MFGLQIRIFLAPFYTSLFYNIHAVDTNLSIIVWSLLRAPIFVCNIKFVDGNTTIWNQPWYPLCCQIQDNLNLEQTTCQIPNLVSNLWRPNSKTWDIRLLLFWIANNGTVLVPIWWGHATFGYGYTRMKVKNKVSSFLRVHCKKKWTLGSFCLDFDVWWSTQPSWTNVFASVCFVVQ